MKTNMLTSIVGTIVALAVAATVWSPSGLQAQEKGAQKLVGAATAPTEAAQPAEMACGKCKTDFSTRVDATARGAYKPAVLIAKHGCCDNSLKVAGVGKNAQAVVTHVCSMGAKAASCCK